MSGLDRLQKMLGRGQAESESKQPPPEEPPSNTERRAWVRLGCDIDSHCRPLGSDDSRWAARILDISQGGIRLLLERRFEPQTILNVQIEVQDEEVAAFMVQVVHVSHDAAAERWSLGCRFPKQLSEKEVEAVMAFTRSE